MSSPAAHTSQHLTPGTDEVEAVGVATTSFIAADDWDILFSAVLSRLRVLAEEMTGPSRSRDGTDGDGRLRAALLLECVDALDRLQAAGIRAPMGRITPDPISPR